MSRTMTLLIALFLCTISLASAAADDPKVLLERGYLRLAAAQCEQRLAADAHDAEAGAVLSRIRSTQGDMDAALKLATAAVAADPKNAQVAGRRRAEPGRARGQDAQGRGCRAGDRSQPSRCARYRRGLLYDGTRLFGW
jgi:hypothetical protein